MNIRTSYESARGCGFRKPGGIYLVSGGYGRYCGALPIPLSVCPTCHAGFKPARGWTWVNLAALAAVRGCAESIQLSRESCGDCPIADARIQDVGLLWVGEKFYPSPGRFADEANAMGITRRISALPRNFKIGETWVALAHRKAIPEKVIEKDDLGMDHEKVIFHPAIFHVFQPARVEYVVKDDDSEEKLEKLEKRGFSLVKVIPNDQQPKQEAA